MAENKVVIKINYDKSKASNSDTTPKTVTVWRTDRVFTAGGVLLIFIIGLVWMLSGKEEVSDTPVVQSNLGKQIDSPASESAKPPTNEIVETKLPIKSVVATESKQAPVPVDAVKRPEAIIYSRRIIRASLNSEIKTDEPGGQIKSPVSLGGKSSMELYYFNEIRNMKGQVLFHLWQKDGQLVQKKQLEIKDVKSKVWSNRVLSTRDKGEWQIKLVDRKGKVYSEANFNIIQ